jgi:hypothetical protein
VLILLDHLQAQHGSVAEFVGHAQEEGGEEGRKEKIRRKKSIIMDDLEYNEFNSNILTHQHYLKA